MSSGEKMEDAKVTQSSGREDGNLQVQGKFRLSRDRYHG